jgi:hypothetical protein
MKCQAKKEIQDPQPATTVHGKPAIRGHCPDCGTRLVRVGAR